MFMMKPHLIKYATYSITILGLAFCTFNLPLLQAQEVKPNASEIARAPIINIFRTLRDFRYDNRAPALIYNTTLSKIADDFYADIIANGANNIKKELLQSRARDYGYPFNQIQLLIGSSSTGMEGLTSVWSGDKMRKIITERNIQHVGIAWINNENKTIKSLPRYVFILVLAEPSVPVSGNWQNQILKLVNQFRQENGLRELLINETLNNVAQIHADDMAIRDYFSHFSPEKFGVDDRAKEHQYHFQRILENLAGAQSTPREVVESWKKSITGHREAMLDNKITEAGVGYHYLDNDLGNVQMNHYWAMVFGKPRP